MTLTEVLLLALAEDNKVKELLYGKKPKYRLRDVPRDIIRALKDKRTVKDLVKDKIAYPDNDSVA